MIAKAVLLGLAAFCAAVQWQGLRGHLTYQGYHHLTEEAGQGRLEQDDAPQIAALLARPAGEAAALDPRRLRTIAVLHMYNVDLTAAAKGISPLQPSMDEELTAARQAALQHLKAAVIRTPYDGDLWLRMAFSARALGRPQEKVTAYLKWSETMAPHEDWILNRRKSLNP